MNKLTYHLYMASLAMNTIYLFYWMYAIHNGGLYSFAVAILTILMIILINSYENLRVETLDLLDKCVDSIEQVNKIEDRTEVFRLLPTYQHLDTEKKMNVLNTLKNFAEEELSKLEK